MKQPREYKTYGKSRSVRLSDFSYAEPNVQYSVTTCCAGRKTYFADERLARIAFDTWLEVLPNKGYRVLALCVMPDHVHVVLLSEEGCIALGDAVGAAKSVSCARAGWGGIRWQPKSRDHVVRASEDIENQLRYTVNNPVRMALVEHWEAWPWTYVYPEYLR